MELLQRYIKEISEDLKYDEMNLREFTLLVPSKKHFWAGRLINHKVELDSLKIKKNRIIKALIQKAEAASPVKLSKINLEKTIEETNEIEELNTLIKEHEMIIEHLERVVDKIMNSLTYDLKNAIGIISIEQL